MHCSYVRALAINAMNKTIVKILKINKYIPSLDREKKHYCYGNHTTL